MSGTPITHCACCGVPFTTIEPHAIRHDIEGKALGFCSEECEIAQMGVPSDSERGSDA